MDSISGSLRFSCDSPEQRLQFELGLQRVSFLNGTRYLFLRGHPNQWQSTRRPSSVVTCCPPSSARTRPPPSNIEASCPALAPGLSPISSYATSSTQAASDEPPPGKFDEDNVGPASEQAAAPSRETDRLRSAQMIGKRRKRQTAPGRFRIAHGPARGFLFFSTFSSKTWTTSPTPLCPSSSDTMRVHSLKGSTKRQARDPFASMAELRARVDEESMTKFSCVSELVHGRISILVTPEEHDAHFCRIQVR